MSDFSIHRTQVAALTLNPAVSAVSPLPQPVISLTQDQVQARDQADRINAVTYQDQSNRIDQVQAPQTAGQVRDVQSRDLTDRIERFIVPFLSPDESPEQENPVPAGMGD
jgi:hypothetical protein